MRFFILASVLVSSGFACSPSNPTGDDAGPGADAASDVVANDVVQPTDSGSSSSVTFSYTPQWKGVTAVSVYGGFGQTGDWTAPLTALTGDGTGTFKGTATLPAGQYLYVFKVVGDAEAGSQAAKYARFAIDPTDSAYAACPMESPTFDKSAPNPCSQLTVPQGAPASLVHVNGLVVSDGAPIAGYLVELERQENASHHFFVNRITTKNDGTFDLVAAPGMYRVQILHPTFLTKTDEERDPTALAAVRRNISSNFQIASGTVAVPSAEVAFHTYGSFSPVDSGTLPTSFAFDTGGTSAQLDVYGTGMDGGAPTIGDPWFTSAATKTGAAMFDGGFNTSKANETSVALGERYFWGVEETIPTDAGVTWTAQSMVFDITWH